jgi:myo-inositol-1(or 4)-monophosphatase
MKKPNAKLKKFLYDTAVGAGNVLMKYYHKAHSIKIKEGAGIVTEADHAAEAFVMKQIKKFYPQSDIITEESGEFLSEKSWCWIIDPLDGTSNYAHQFPSFCVSIGLHEDGEGKAGVIYHPILKELFYAEKGCGAYLNNKKISVSKISKVSQSLFGTGFYYSKGEPLRVETEIFRKMNEAALAVRRPGSAALDLAYVACGRYEGFWERGLSSWDVAAGFVLISEAGGKMSDYTGKPTDVFHKEVIASNGVVHNEMVSIISS